MASPRGARGSGGKSRGLRRRGGGPVERYLPLAYMVMAVLVVVILLPSALRPPAQQSTQTAQFSPNAPHQNQQSIIAAFQQASSGTAGAGTGNGTAPGVGAGPPGLQLPPPKGVPNFCPHGFGIPPRQTADIYSGPCATAWKGNNGGATWQGVTGNTIKICVQGNGAGNNPSANGPVAAQESASQNAWDRTYTVFQRYFNQNFQFYGRQVQFIVSDPSGSGIAAEQTAAVSCDQQYGVFGAWTGNEPECSYFGPHGILAFCPGGEEQSYYTDSGPNLWTFSMSGEELSQLTAEWICKQLAGKDAAWAGEADYQHTKRKFGLLLYDTRGYQYLGPYMAGLLKSECGVNLDIVYSDLDTQSGEASLGQAVTKFKSDGVTSVLIDVDYISSAVFTNDSANEDWFPEFLDNGGGALDRNQLASLQNQTEWAHAFGITPGAMERPLEDTDCYRSYQSVDPANTPAFVFCDYDYDSLYMLMTAIQDAGPDLTPANVEAGLYKLGFRYPDPPKWAVGGGFAPGRHTYVDDVAMSWWNPTAPPPDPNTYGTASDNVGAYEYIDIGQRYRPGQMPSTTAPFFASGTTVAPDPTAYGD